MQRYQNSVLLGGPGCIRPAPFAVVTVYSAGSHTLATLYATNDEAPLANPLHTDAQGNFFFYAADGRYDIHIVVPGRPEQWLRDTLLEDINEDGLVHVDDLAIKEGDIDPTPGYPAIPSVGQPNGAGSLNAQAQALTAWAKENRSRLDGLNGIPSRVAVTEQNVEVMQGEISDLQDRALSGEYYSYETESAMLADIANRADGDSLKVTNDPDAGKNGYYTVYSGAAVYSGLQPATVQDVQQAQQEAAEAMGAYGASYARPGYSFRPDMWHGFGPEDMDQDASGFAVAGQVATVGLAREIDSLARSAMRFSPDRWHGDVGGPAELDQASYVVSGALADEGLAKEIDSGGGGSGSAVRLRVTKYADACSIFCKGAGGQNWIEYNLIRQTNSNRDLWRLGQAYETDANQIRIREVTPDSEWLCAIREPNAVIGAGGDATGGWHGYEFTTEAYWLVDGVYRAADWAGTASPRRLEFIHKSDINRWGTSDLLCRAVKHLTFDENGVDIVETLEWLPSGSPIVGPISLLSAWLPMLPIRRNQDGATGALITDHATRERAYQRLDVSEPNLSIEDVSTFDAGGEPTYTYDTARCTTWGDASGISATSRMLSSEMWTLSGGELVPLDPNPEAYFYIDIRAAQYNKHYWNVGRSMTVNAGDLWRIHAHIAITTRN